jgi:hypothetical protein
MSVARFVFNAPIERMQCSRFTHALGLGRFSLKRPQITLLGEHPEQRTRETLHAALVDLPYHSGSFFGGQLFFERVIPGEIDGDKQVVQFKDAVSNVLDLREQLLEFSSGSCAVFPVKVSAIIPDNILFGRHIRDRKNKSAGISHFYSSYSYFSMELPSSKEAANKGGLP